MKRKSLFWCMATLMLPIMFNQLTICVSAENSNDTLDTTDTSVLSSYETSIDNVEESTYTETLEPTNDEVSTSHDVTLEPTEYTTTIDVLETTTYDEPLEDYIESVTEYETLETTTEDTTITTLETTTTEVNSSLDGNVVVVSVYDDTTTDTSTTSEISVVDVNAVSSDNESSIHTLSNTDITKTSSSPKTSQITVIVPILLLMAGALFMSATANPNKSKN
jgi:hypothetical protein